MGILVGLIVGLVFGIAGIVIAIAARALLASLVSPDAVLIAYFALSPLAEIKPGDFDFTFFQNLGLDVEGHPVMWAFIALGIFCFIWMSYSALMSKFLEWWPLWGLIINALTLFPSAITITIWLRWHWFAEWQLFTNSTANTAVAVVFGILVGMMALGARSMRAEGENPFSTANLLGITDQQPRQHQQEAINQPQPQRVIYQPRVPPEYVENQHDDNHNESGSKIIDI